MIGLVLAAALANGTYTYKTTYNGADLGTSTVQVQNGGTSITEHVQGTYLGTSGNANATLTLNPDLSPASYRASGTMGGHAMTDAATVANGVANVTTAQGQARNVALPAGVAHFVFVDLGTIAGFVALPEQMEAWKDAPVCAVLPSMGQSLQLAPQTAAATGGPAGDVAVAFSNPQAPFTIWYNPATLVPDLISIPSQNLTVTRV